MALEDSTYSEKHFLSGRTESAAASTASVRTGTDDGVLFLDSSLTLVNAQGTGTTFAFGYAHDTVSFGYLLPSNDHESLDDLRADVRALLDAVREWGDETLNALYDFEEASEDRCFITSTFAQNAG